MFILKWKSRRRARVVLPYIIVRNTCRLWKRITWWYSDASLGISPRTCSHLQLLKRNLLISAGKLCLPLVVFTQLLQRVDGTLPGSNPLTKYEDTNMGYSVLASLLEIYSLYLYYTKIAIFINVAIPVTDCINPIPFKGQLDISAVPFLPYQLWRPQYTIEGVSVSQLLNKYPHYYCIIRNFLIHLASYHC